MRRALWIVAYFAAFMAGAWLEKHTGTSEWVCVPLALVGVLGLIVNIGMATSGYDRGEYVHALGGHQPSIDYYLLDRERHLRGDFDIDELAGRAHTRRLREAMGNGAGPVPGWDDGTFRAGAKVLEMPAPSGLAPRPTHIVGTPPARTVWAHDTHEMVRDWDCGKLGHVVVMGDDRCVICQGPWDE